MDLNIGNEQTFTVTGVPNREAQRKTIQRLMRMQPSVQRGLDNLARRRRQTDNNIYRRGGRLWNARARMTRLTNVRSGESFTIFVTPQIVNDINSVESFLKTE